MSIYRLPTDKWYLERAVYLVAGIFVLGSVILGINVSENFFYFTGLVGGMLIFFSFSSYCPMAIALNKLGIKCRLKREDEQNSHQD